VRSAGAERSEDFSSILLAQAAKLTRSFKVTFYDAAYHALAIVERGVFVTADLQYLKKGGQGRRCCPPSGLAVGRWGSVSR